MGNTNVVNCLKMMAFEVTFPKVYVYHGTVNIEQEKRKEIFILYTPVAFIK